MPMKISVVSPGRAPFVAASVWLLFVSCGGSSGQTTGAGSDVQVYAAGTQEVTFANLAPVLDLVAGPLTVNGTNGNNAINYTQGSVAANGLVSVDNF